MKSKDKRIIFGSITRELLFVNIISFIIVIIAAMSIGSLLMVDPDSTDNMQNKFNSLYVDANRIITRKDEGCRDYLNQLALLYKCDAAITDLQGNVILKSQDINYDKVDLDRLYSMLQGTYKSNDTFYQIYNMRIQNQDCRLIVSKIPKSQSDYSKSALFVMIIIISLVIVIIYLPTRKKAKYIKEIVSGIKTISEGNLNYRVKSKGADELAILADEINNMSDNLKSQIEEERKAERLKSELITNVSHDLRTPLTSLTAYIHLVNDDKTSSENKEKYSKIAEEKAAKLKNLIEDLFEYSKLESGGIKLQKSEVNIIEIIEQSIGELSIQAKNKGIVFNKRFERSIILLNIDSDKMARVFENIISNAVKYSESGSAVNIDVKEENDGVIISFENTSEAVLNENADKIFERFYRSDKSRSSETEGSGLGLAIAKSIVILHGGRIWAEVHDKIFKINIRMFNM